MSRIFAYARVSTADQTTENQRLEIAGAGFSIEPHRFVAENISGSVCASQRPAFAALLDKMEKGDTLIVTKLDRLGRDSIDVQQTIEGLRQRGITVQVLQFGKVDLSSAFGGFFLQVLSAVAEFERSLIIERTQAGLTRAKAQGKKLGRQSKTTEEQQREIVSRLNKGESVSSVALMFSISRASVIAIRNRANEVL